MALAATAATPLPASLWHVPGALPWLWLVTLGTIAALALDVAYAEGGWRVRAARALAIFGTGGVALWAVTLVWAPTGGAPFALQSVAWWMLALPVLVLGVAVPAPQGPPATARLAVTQAAPAIVLSFASVPGVAPLGALAAGFIRVAAPPLHPMILGAVDALPPGAAGLLLLAGLVIGGPVAVQAALAVGVPIGRWLALALGAAIGVAGLASAVDRHLLRRMAVWASVQGGLGILLVLLPPAAVGPRPAGLALAHLGASAAALPLLFFVIGRVTAAARAVDLGAHAGLLGATAVRGHVVPVAALIAILASARAPFVLAVALGARIGGVAWFTLDLALAGWVGAGLALLLGSYRIVRGERSVAEGVPPELTPAEGALVALLGLAAVWAFAFRAAWAAP
jgi:hypothetical protein